MNKKLLFLLCLIMLISTVSFASAADDVNQTIGNGADTGTFTELEEKISNAQNASTVELDKDYVYDGQTNGYGINITKDITINGNGHTIDANHTSRIFNLSFAKVVLNNIVFANAFSSMDGGAIYGNFMNDDYYRYSYLEINNCSFINNTAHCGCAIYTFFENLKINNCSFVNNTARYSGGAIELFDSDTLIVNSIFLNNSAYEGAAVYFWHDIYWRNFTISNSVFNDNHAEESYFWIDEALDCGYWDVCLRGEDNLADNQIKLYYSYDFYMVLPLPDIYFSNVSYNEFKNQSFKVKKMTWIMA